jgi:outer membrane protein TolC
LASADAALAGAEHNTLPELDLGLSVGYAGAVQAGGADTFFTSAARNVPGVNGAATLTLELPIENTRQRAERDLRRATRWSAEIDRDDITRHVRTEVQSALDELRLSAAALAAATDAVRLLEQAVGDERDKLREGLSTVIDVVLTEERLTQAQLLKNSDQLRYSIALAGLQFEAGALPSREAEVATSPGALLSREAVHGGR